jgi:putative serine protease PepD
VNGISAPVGGDVITAVAGKDVRTSQELANDIAAHKPSDRVALTVVRGGKTRTPTVTLGNAPMA